MNKKINPLRIIVAASLMTTIAMLIFFDYQRVQRDFRNLKTKLRVIRFETLEKNRTFLVKFEIHRMSVSDYQTGEYLESMPIPTLKEVKYDTKLGKDTIVFDMGTTNRFNNRIHGGEISLRSWFGFVKNIHVNCAGYVREGQYPED